MGLHHHHGHDPHHGHAHSQAPGGNGHVDRTRERRKLMLTVVLTAIILVAEVVGGLVSRSLSLLSDAGHVLSDLVAQLLALVAVVLATRPADARRTYGWYRLEILAALMNGVILFALAIVLVWQGATRLRTPVEVHTGLMLVVAAVGLVANLVGAWLLHGSRTLNARGAYLHLVLDTLSSVAVVGGGLAMHFTHGLYWLDPVLSMAIGVIILYNAYRLVRDAVDILLEAVPKGIDLAGVAEAIDRIPGVAKVHDLHVWTITSGLYALSAHIVVTPERKDAHDALINQVKEMLQRDFAIGHTTLQLESQDYDHACHVC